jgi:hypothetical protein
MKRWVEMETKQFIYTVYTSFIFGFNIYYTPSLVEILFVAFTETEREYEALVTSPSQKPARGV